MEVEVEVRQKARDAGAGRRGNDFRAALDSVGAPKRSRARRRWSSSSEGFILNDPGFDDRAGHAVGRRAHEPLRAAPRHSFFDASNARMTREPFDRSTRRSRASSSGWRCSRRDLRRHRQTRRDCSSGSSGAVRLLPDWRRIRREAIATARCIRSSVEVSRKGALVRSRRQLLNHACRPQGDAQPPADGRGGAQLAAHRVGSAAAGRVVRPPGTGARSDSDADPRRHRQRLLVVEASRRWPTRSATRTGRSSPTP